jgi:putative transposase
MRSLPDTYFVTAAIARRRTLLQNQDHAALLAGLTFRFRDEGRYFLHAFVIMPDHMHALITPSYDHSVERCMDCIKGGFSHSVSSSGLAPARVWQRGYREHKVRDADDFVARKSYIAQNPEDWGLRDYPHVHVSGPLLDPMPKRLRA